MSQSALLESFVDAFRRAILEEVEAMRTRSDVPEVTVADGRPEPSDGERLYSFAIVGNAARLSEGDECTLRHSGGETRVTLTRFHEGRVWLVASRPLTALSGPTTLVSVPWFLYERMISALEDLDAGSVGVTRALALFGKGDAQIRSKALVANHVGLNQSQVAAVKLCSDGELAFVWGPPGTGKTTTLASIVSELLAQGKRVLLASTTNAALDQALAKLMPVPELARAVTEGEIVRIGRTDAETFGTTVAEVTERRRSGDSQSLGSLLGRIGEAERIAERGRALADALASSANPQQSLFAEPQVSVRAVELSGLFPSALTESFSRRPARELRDAVLRRVSRFERLAKLARSRAAKHRGALREGMAETVTSARLVLSTLANCYLSPFLSDARFDVSIIEEASMAVLPTLFYAASLGEEKTVIVGDPRQLPPIVTAESRLARQALGRNIFEVTVPDPHGSELVAMLDTQYRMAPAIGELVGELFYGGRLRNGETTSERAAIAKSVPFAGEPLIVVDITGQTVCERAADGSSRLNRISAERAATLAAEADSHGQFTVAVITPYAAQAREIRKGLVKRRVSDRVECSTIHRFQGQERDVVIIDLVDTDPMPPSRLLSDSGTDGTAARLLNVSISRALGKLIIIGDIGYFSAELPQSVATMVLDAARRRGVCRAAEPRA